MQLILIEDDKRTAQYITLGLSEFSLLGVVMKNEKPVAAPTMLREHVWGIRSTLRAI